MRKSIALISGIIFMFVFSLQMAAPASAAGLKVVDHGSVNFNVHNSTCTYTWKTYQRGTSFVEMIGYMYSPKTNVGVYTYLYLQKVSKNKVKTHGKDIAKDYNSGTSQTITISTQYIPTKLTAAQCYWNYAKPEILSELSNGFA